VKWPPSSHLFRIKGTMDSSKCMSWLLCADFMPMVCVALPAYLPPAAGQPSISHCAPCSPYPQSWKSRGFGLMISFARAPSPSLWFGLLALPLFLILMTLAIGIIFSALRHPWNPQPGTLDGPLEVILGRIAVACQDRVQVLLLPSNLPNFPQSFTSFPPFGVDKKA
jgi:hypothetical protein